MPELTSATTTLGERQLTYTLRASSRARHPGLWMDPAAGLVVTAPRGFAPDDASAFLRRHQRWVLRWIARLERRWQGLPKRWPYGQSLLYRGQPLTVRVIGGRRGTVALIDDQHLVVATRTPSIDGARRVLSRWLKQQALQTLTERTEALASSMQLSPGRIYVRSLRRTWGRCWPSGSLSFSYHLIMAPREVLEYVVVHELAHLKERNHSRDFWALVAAHHPEYQQRCAWLRTHGPWLAV
ncbi:MAG: M48 family metallopeptidase [Candidatus Omnitrophica bacterium]|nr:M48 family metallopeptidase [Candidatus Omnitrophota bacterium]